MKPITRLPAAASVAVALTGLLLTAPALAQQDDPFTGLKTYDFQARQPVEAIRVMIDQAASDRAATAQIEQKLDDVLADPSASYAGRQEAARFLWIIGTGRSVPVLSKLLLDEKLSDVARYGLERDSDPSAGKALVDALPMAQGRILVGIINSIGDRGDADAVPALKRYLTDPDPLVAEAATVAAGKIGTPAAIALLKTLPPANVTAGVALRRAAERLAAGGKRPGAAQVYALLWNPARPSNIRGEAVRGLANIGAPNAPAVALAALSSSDPYLQIVAAQTIGSVGDPKTVARALSGWSALSPPVQVALLTVLAERRDAAVAPIAILAIGNPDPAIRAAGIRAAGRVGGAAAVPRIVDVMVHGEGSDRGVARQALAGMPGADAEKAIFDLARQGAPDARAAIVEVLGDRPTPAAVAALLETARGTDARSAVAAVRALGRIGSEKEHGELVALLVSTRDDNVRDAARDAVVAVGQRMGDRDRAAAPVLAAYSTSSGPARTALVATMAEMGGDRALEELTRAAASQDAELKQAAVRGLADTWGDTRALPTLLAIAKSDPDTGLRVQALRGYLRLVSQDEGMAAQERVARIQDALKVAERPQEKQQALSILRDARSPAAIELASQYLSDPALFGDAANTILYLAGPQRRNNRELPAVRGEGVTAALDKIIQTTHDDNQRAQAEKLK